MKRKYEGDFFFLNWALLNYYSRCELLHGDLRHLAESRGTFEGIFLDTQILRNIGEPMVKFKFFLLEFLNFFHP